MSRVKQQVQHFTKIEEEQKIKILEVDDRIWNKHEKFIQINPNMPVYMSFNINLTFRVF